MIGLSAGAIVGALAGLSRITARRPRCHLVALLSITGAFINATQTTLYALAAHVPGSAGDERRHHRNRQPRR